MPDRAAVALTRCFLLAAVKVAVTVAAPAGANLTLTTQDLPGRSRVPLQRSRPMVNAAAPSSVTFSLPVTLPPELVSRNRCEALSPGVTRP